MARYDIPASIDFVLNHTTGYESLHYVGHSQGTLIAFVHLSLNPNYKKVGKVAPPLPSSTHQNRLPAY